MAEQAKITRVTAKDTKEKTPKRAKKPASKADDEVGYFKGAWLELKQVRWPTRKATWGLTLAVLIFTGFFLLLVTGLDTLFKYLFELIIT